MNLSSVLSLIDGELVSSPKISSFASITTNIGHIKRGDLFIALDKTQIVDAIRAGAYGVVFTGWTQISDSEIAWIKVRDIHKTLDQLIRFFIISKNIDVIAIDLPTLELAALLFQSNRVHIYRDRSSMLEALYSQPLSLILAPEHLLKSLALDSVQIPSKPLNIVQHYLFETSFVYDDVYYQRMRISPLFIDKLHRLLDIAHNYLLHYSFQKVEEWPHFRPYFLDNNFRVCEFGKSERVVILESDCTLLEREHQYLQKHAPWAHKLFFTHSCIQDGFAQYNLKRLREILYNATFNYALCEHFDIEKLAKTQEQKRLF
ncbi:hypothetical protein [Nitratiruptor sp. YY09-18]|uniref:hypothetical protein n=1 Tax=Nitratiruptor sp. YY09-18 TaxID=2724901 RepID=UPI001914ED16|nr:hypothetical protein [Nitratiruptor sp. YY09-18]BCD68010.1 protoporphyrin/coproporphyrin ferrochelatase [Nitratiruptor sp. YY09-18]